MKQSEICAVIIETATEADVKFWLNLAKRIGARARAINTDSLEDKFLGELIEKGMRTRNVSHKRAKVSLESLTGPTSGIAETTPLVDSLSGVIKLDKDFNYKDFYKVK